MNFYSIHCCLIFLLSCCISSQVFGQTDEVSDVKFSMEIDGYTLKIPVFSNKDIFTTDASVEKAVIVIQGAKRNAGSYLENLQIAANNAAVNTANVLLVAPQFLTEEDIVAYLLDFEHLYWSSGGWKSGSNSKDEITFPRPARIPSYAVLDRLLLHLAEQFPNLKSIVFTGHSAGGQVTQRMAASSPITDMLCKNFGIDMRFVVINPSSYVYMDRQRRNPGSQTEFSIPANPCIEFNEWKYGLDDLYTYPETFGVDSIRNMYKRRLVTYLLGADDNDPNSSSLDTDCEAMLQGAQRLERGQVYFNYMKHYYGDSITQLHDFTSVPNAGHNSLEMFNSVEGRYVIFEKSINSCNEIVKLNELSNAGDINVSPNPASSFLNITSPTPDVKNFHISIYNLQGQRVLSTTSASNNSLDINALSNGAYLIFLRTEEQRIYKKIIVQK